MTEITDAIIDAELDEWERTFMKRRDELRLIAAYRESQAEARRLQAENEELRISNKAWARHVGPYGS